MIKLMLKCIAPLMKQPVQFSTPATVIRHSVIILTPFCDIFQTEMISFHVSIDAARGTTQFQRCSFTYCSWSRTCLPSSHEIRLPSLRSNVSRAI